MEDWYEVCSAEALRPREPLGVQLGDVHVAVFRLEDGIFATHGVCTHAFALLAKGFVEGDSIECPLHEGRFDIRTGKCLARPPTRNVKTYPVREQDGKVHVLLDTADTSKSPDPV